MTNELKTLLPGESYTLTNGSRISIRPIPFGKLHLFSEAVASLIIRLQETGLKLQDISDWKIVFDIAFEEIVRIMMLILGKPRKWFDTITITDGIGILNIIIEQNFSEDTKKNITLLIGKLNLILSTASRPSSVPDIHGETFRTTQ